MRAARETIQSPGRGQSAEPRPRHRAAAGELTRFGALAGGLCLSMLLSVPGAAAPAPAPSPASGGSARVSLLPAGPRASVLVELDDTDIAATAIEATDNHTVAVEIGPVRGKVVNQLLQAAESSPLVSQVRVRGITHGSNGTVVTIQITAKAPISGSVRRTARRIYIDLEPRVTSPALRPSAPVPSPSAPAVPRTSAPVSARTSAPPAPAAKPATEPLAKATALPKPVTDVPARPPAAVATNTKATSVDEFNKRADRLRRASDIKGLEKLREDVAKQPTGMEMSDASKTVLLAQVDSLLDEARRQRLLNDAALFRSQPGNNVMAAPAPGGAVPPPPSMPAAGGEAPAMATAPAPSASPASPTTAAAASPAPARPATATPSPGNGNGGRGGAPVDSGLAQAVQDVRTMKASLQQWQPGYVPAPTFAAQAQALSLRLQQLTVPPQVAIPMSTLTAALVNLASTWVPSPDGSMIPFRNDALEVERTKNAMDAFLDAVAAQQLSAQR